MPGRLLAGTLALVLAIPAGTLALGAGVLLDPATRETLARLGLAGLLAGLMDLAGGVPPDMAVMALMAFAQALSLLLVLPPVLVALVGETLGLRTLLWYGGATGLLTAALPWLVRGPARPAPGTPAHAAEVRLAAILFLAGATSGLVYGWVAGRGAGPRGPR